MTKKIFWLLFWLILLSTSALAFAQNVPCGTNQKRVNGTCTDCSVKWVCCGVKLNTNIPFIWDCIEMKSKDSTSEITEENAFPTLMAWFTKLLMTVILIVCFLVIIVAWVLRTTWDSKKWKDMIKWVAIALALLWASGVILRLVNPNFFG